MAADDNEFQDQDPQVKAADLGGGEGPPAVPDNVAGLWSSPLGVRTLALEKKLMATAIRQFHGDTALWMGSHWPAAQDMSRCMVRHTIYAQQDQNAPEQLAAGDRIEGGPVALAADLQALPFKTSSFDAVVLHHALEQVRDPRVALREVARVISPGGRVVICGFNPMSLIGIHRLYAKLVKDPLADNGLVNPLRLFDWLTLLGFELEYTPVYAGYGLSLQGLTQRLQLPRLHAWGQRLAAVNLPFGSVLMINAVKQSTAGRPQWRSVKQRAQLAPVAYPRVASWQRNEP